MATSLPYPVSIDMKQALKTIGTLATIAAAFTAGLMWTGMRDFTTGFGGPHIKSDYLVRQHIRHHLVQV